MDQRLKGGSPPSANPTLDPSSAPEDSGQDQVAEKRRNGDVGAKEEERRGAGKKREGEKGAVLELLIEGRCGSAGQQQLQISGRETTCPDGNVRLRIGLQAKRTKKPPKILESYVCKPTIRTYQRQGRGGLLRGDGEGGGGGGGQQGKSNSDEASRENRSGLDAIQTTSKHTTSAASPPLTSSSSPSSSSQPQPPSLTSTYTTAAPPASAPAATCQGTKSAKQVPIKLAYKTEANGSSERAKKEKLVSANGQPVSAGPKPCPPATDPTASLTPSAQPLTPSAAETRTEGETSKKHNGLVQTKKQKGLSNGKGSADNLSGTPSSKVKVGKHGTSSSLSSMDLSARPPSSHKELSQKNRADCPSSPSVTPKPQSPPTVDLSSAQSQDQQPSPKPTQEKKREKERKLKKEKRKEKKAKRDRLEAERAKCEGRKEEGKKKKKDKGKDGKSKHSKEKDDRQRSDDSWRDDLKTERGKAEKKRDKLSPDRQRKEDNGANCGGAAESAKLDKTCKAASAGRSEEKDAADDSCKPVKQAELPTTGDTSKSKEQDVSRHSAVPPCQPSSSCSSSAPPSLPAPTAHAPISPPSSSQEQDSRPLKKRKARRPSWTKLVHRAQRAENQEASSDSQHNPLLSFSQSSKTSLPAKATIRQSDESHPAPASSLSSGSSPLSVSKPSSPKQNISALEPSPPSASKYPQTPARKRGRPKSHTSPPDEPPLRVLSHVIPNEAPAVGCDEKAPGPEPSLPPPPLQGAAQSKISPKKRGRPPKRPLPEDRGSEDLTVAAADPHPPEKGNRQLKIRRLINEMKKRKKRRLHKVLLSGYVGKEGKRVEGADGETSSRMCKSIEATTVHTLSALSSSFGGKLGPQINVSKRGTIYMGKRRGRKPKAQNQNTASQSFAPSSLFSVPAETSLFSSQSQAAPSHPFPSPSLTHSSGAQSPYSEGSVTEPAPSLLFPHPFSLPSPSSSCTSPRPPSSSASLSPFVKKSCPCQGRPHFPFHQSSCKLSCPTPPLHHAPGSPGHLKEATPSPRSESHSEETLPSDSGIGTDNNSVSERVEMRGGRGMLRLGQGSGGILGAQKHSSLVDRSSPVSSPLSLMPRHANSIAGSSTLERHRERHRHRRRDYNCSSSCTCLCPCPCPGHNKCTHSDYYPCLGHSALKRQKNKHKKKHQQMHMQDPEFLSELEDLIGQFSEVHIGRRSWARTGLGQGFEGSGNAVGGRRHHSSPSSSSSSHSLRSNIFRINLNGFYSPHPSSYPASASFSPQPFYPCQPVHCNRKPERRQCGCPSKFQETIDNMGYYGSYPPAAATLYHHLPSSYPLPSPHQYAAHQPHHAHFLLNPARFHRRRSRLLREGTLGGDIDGDMGGGGGSGSGGVGGGGGPHLGSGYGMSSFSCSCGRNKHKRRHRQCERDLDDDEDLHEDEEEDGMEGLPTSKPRSRFVLGQGDAGRKGARAVGSVLSKESPWLCENGNDSFSFSAASSSSSSERFKHTSLTSLGLGSSHLSSFGGGWGGLGQSWTKLGGGGGFGSSGWRSFSAGRQASRRPPSDQEDDDDDDDDAEELQQSHLCRTSPSPTHTNLFTSAAMVTGGRGLRSGLASRNAGDRSRRREEPAWTERREAGLQGDSRSRGQQKSVPTPDSAEVKNKRRPGRPRKHPLPSALSPPPAPHSSPPPPPTPSPDLSPGRGLNVGGRKDERGPGRERGVGGGGGGGDPVPQVTEAELQARRKRGRKRKHSDSPCHQSVAEDQGECDTATECFSQSDAEQVAPQPVPIQREERADGPPRKKFLRAGLYSDDYKTTDPPSQAQQLCKGSAEYTPGERDYSLLPAPLHVGKYLRLKRIHFQLPYDVMWLWRHNQLHRQPAVPLKRKRRYCRLKERAASSHQAAEESSSDIISLFPHLDMEPLSSSERSFVVKHHVFLVRNWDLVRDRQMMKMDRGRDRDEEDEEADEPHLSCDGANGDDGHIKSDQRVGVEVTVFSGEPCRQSQDTSSLLTASPCPTKTQNRPEEEGEEEKRGEEDVCSREQRRKRLNDLLLTLQHS